MCGSLENMDAPPTDCTMTLTSQDLEQFLSANLPEGALLATDTSGSGGEDPRLLAAARAATEHGSQAPLLKEELRQHIFLRRHRAGMPQITLTDSTSPTDYKLTPAEEEKKERRKEQNRRAARKCRLKKRDEEGSVRKKHETLLTRRHQLHTEVTELQQYLASLRTLMMTHLAVCNWSPQPPAPPQPGEAPPDLTHPEYLPIPAPSFSSDHIGDVMTAAQDLGILWGSELDIPDLMLGDYAAVNALDTGPEDSTPPLNVPTLGPSLQGYSARPVVSTAQVATVSDSSLMVSNRLVPQPPNFLACPSPSEAPHSQAVSVSQAHPPLISALPRAAPASCVEQRAVGNDHGDYVALDTDLPGYPFHVRKRKHTNIHEESGQGIPVSKVPTLVGHFPRRASTPTGRQPGPAMTITTSSTTQSCLTPPVNLLTGGAHRVGLGCQSAPPVPATPPSSRFFTFPSPRVNDPYPQVFNPSPYLSVTPPPSLYSPVPPSPYGAPTPSPSSPGGLRVVPGSGLPSPAVSVLGERGSEEDSSLYEQHGPLTSSWDCQEGCLTTLTIQDLMDHLQGDQDVTCQWP